MYINYDAAYSRGLDASAVHNFLQVYNYKYSKQEFEVESILVDKGLVCSKGRVSKKGRAFLKLLTTPVKSSATIDLAEKLISMYLDAGLDDLVGSKLEIIHRLDWFLTETHIKPAMIIMLIQDYIDENATDTLGRPLDDLTYVRTLPNLIWRPKDVRFSKNMNLRDSWLFSAFSLKFKHPETSSKVPTVKLKNFIMKVLAFEVPKICPKEIPDAKPVLSALRDLQKEIYKNHI